MALLGVLAWLGAAPPLSAQETMYRGRPLDAWRQDLQTGPPMVRERAVVALYEFGEPAVPLLIDAIGDQDFNTRTMAIFCLGRLGPRAKDAVPALINTLQDRHWIVRKYAAGALGLFEGEAKAAVPALARAAVEDSNAEVRQTATYALARLGPPAREAATPVLQQLSTGTTDDAVRMRAGELLRDMEKR